MRYQRHAQDLFGQQGGFSGIFRHLHAATLAAPARVDLGFHDNGAADFLRGCFGFGHRKSDLPAGYGNIEPGKNCLGLILVDFHFGDVSDYAWNLPGTQNNRTNTNFPTLT